MKNGSKESLAKLRWSSLFFAGLTMLTPAFASVSLDDAFRATLERNEDAASQDEAVFQAEEIYKQARSALFPNINLIASYLKQEQPTSGTGSAISPSDQKLARINAVQPLFRGFREWAGIKQQAILSEAAKYNREAVLTQLYVDVSTTYYQSLLASMDLADLTKEFDANQKRKEELLRFRNLGRSRETEVLTTEANLASIEAQIEASKTVLQNSQTAFSLLTGMPANAVLTDKEVYPSVLPSLETFVSKIEDRPDIKRLVKSTDASEKSIAIARGGHLPSLDLIGNYYFVRPGVLSNVDWDVTLSLTFPIFQGGAILSQTRQAVSINKQNELALSKGRRLARQEIETLYASVVSDRTQFQKWQKSVDASSKSYQAQLKDYRLGIVTNLDVLAALTAAQNAQRSLDRADIQYRSDYIRLQAAIAERPKVAKGTNP